jgi:hypothetical protein
MTGARDQVSAEGLGRTLHEPFAEGLGDENAESGLQSGNPVRLGEDEVRRALSRLASTMLRSCEPGAVRPSSI